MVFVSVRPVANDTATTTTADACAAKLVAGWLRLFPDTDTPRCGCCTHLVRVKQLNHHHLPGNPFGLVAGRVGQIVVSGFLRQPPPCFSTALGALEYSEIPLQLAIHIVAHASINWRS